MKLGRDSRLVAGACGLMISALVWSGNAGPLDTWTWLNPQPSASPIYDVAHGSGLFVAVGDFGTVMTSADAKTWTLQKAVSHPTLANGEWLCLNRLVCLNRTFITWQGVGHGGILLASADGTDWVSSVLPNVDSIVDIAFGNGKFVAIANDWTESNCGSVWTSRDATNWETPYRLEVWSFFSQESGLVFAGGRFLIRPSRPDSDALESRDGITWSPVSLPEETPRFWGVRTFEDNAFAARGTNVWKSQDGVNWIPLNAGATTQLRKVSVSEGVIFALGDSRVARSTDGLNWVELPTISPELTLRAVAGSTNATAAAVENTDGSFGLSFQSLSEDSAWTEVVNGPSDVDLLCIDSMGSAFVAGGHAEARAAREGALLFSANGESWSETYREPVAWFSSITHGNGKFLALGLSKAGASEIANTFVVSSTDGKKWRDRVKVGKECFNAATFGNGLFVIAGGEYYSEIATSWDAISWTIREIDWSDIVTAIEFGNGTFVAVGYRYDWFSTYGKVWTSPNGIKWSVAEIPGVAAFHGVTFAEGRFLATAAGGAIYTSIDGIRWRKAFENPAASFGRVVYGNGIYLAPANSHLSIFTSSVLEMWASQDGTNWEAHSAPGFISSLWFHGDSFFAVGLHGAVLKSDPILTFRMGGAPAAGDSVSLEIRGTPGKTIEILGSENLQKWDVLDTVNVTKNVERFFDITSNDFSIRFYQLRTVQTE